MNKLLDVKELAALLKLTPGTVKVWSSQQPEKLPPRCAVPYNRLVWSLNDVEAWIEEHSLKEK
jgi:predicted DNA-binding transcriptional regulator AlpA